MSFDSSSGHLTEKGNIVEFFIASDNEKFQIDFKIDELKNAKKQFIVLSLSDIESTTLGFLNKIWVILVKV